MNKKEFTKKELVELLSKDAVDGKVSFDNLSKIIFDPRFPEHLFSNATEQIIRARDDHSRYDELSVILVEKYQYCSDLLKQIMDLSRGESNSMTIVSELREQLACIEQEIEPLQMEFDQLKARIAERRGE
ncbi:MAG TPA: hypothetical protein VEC12_03175 [Bacteroidia bacterium]|nr:hypothetical protein [Bacteroidia bacterium]